MIIISVKVTSVRQVEKDQYIRTLGIRKSVDSYDTSYIQVNGDYING